MKNTTRKTLIGINIIAIVIMFIAIIYYISFGVITGDTHIEFERTLIAENGQMFTVDWEDELEIDKSGKYVIGAKWERNEEATWDSVDRPEIITAFSFVNEDGEVLFYVTGVDVDAESVPLNLTAGTYTMKYQFFANDEDFHAFVEENGNEPIINDLGDFSATGSESTNFVIDVSKNIKSSEVTVIVMALCLGLLIGILMNLLVKTGSGVKSEYDERQEAIRGKAYRTGFIFLSIYMVIFASLDFLEIKVPAETAVINFIGFFIGLLAVVTITIMNDGYFAINDNKKNVVVTLIIVSIINLFSAINNIIDGRVIVDGKLSLGSINIICAIALAYTLFVLLIKSIKDKREDD